jgi:hypothetical protein
MLRRIVFLVALVSFCAPAFGQEAPDLEKRVKALEEENARLRKALADAAARLRGAMTALERETLATMTAAPPAAPKPEDAGKTADDPPAIAAVRAAHATRDRAKIAAAEDALHEAAREDQAVADAVRKALFDERQFDMKVSLQWVQARLDRRATLGDFLKAMHGTQESSEKMRYAFVMAKLPLDSEGDVAELSRALADEKDPVIKKYLVRAAGSSSRGGELLARIARESGDRDIRVEAIQGIHALEDRAPPAAVQAVLAISTSEEDAAVRSVAVRALASTAGDDCKPFFFNLLEKDDRTNNRAEAARFFGARGTRADIAKLTEIARIERVYYIRQKVMQAIEAIQKREGMEPQ